MTETKNDKNSTKVFILLRNQSTNSYSLMTPTAFASNFKALLATTQLPHKVAQNSRLWALLPPHKSNGYCSLTLLFAISTTRRKEKQIERTRSGKRYEL